MFRIELKKYQCNVGNLIFLGSLSLMSGRFKTMPCLIQGVPFNFQSPAKVGGKGSKGYAADDDVKRVREAMKGWGTDEEPLIQILAGRTNEQRQQIRKKYQEKYKSVSWYNSEAVIMILIQTTYIYLQIGRYDLTQIPLFISD